MNDVLVSVLMPAFNTEKYISASINSILDQSYKNFELIIVDDSSTDGTWNLIQEFSKKDNRILSFRNAQNLYIAGNRNECLKKARGKYVVWQDSDDISLPNRIEHQVAFMESNPSVGICGGYLQSFNDDTILDIRKYDCDDETLRKNIFKYSPVAQPAAIVRKECFDRVGDYNITLPPAEDIDMSFRIGQYYKFANLSEVVIKYREHLNNNTMARMKKMVKNTLIVRKLYSKNYGYSMRFSDRIAYFLTWLMQFVPPTLVVYMFKAARRLVRLKI